MDTTTTFRRADIEANREHWRRVLNKPDPSAAVKTPAERRAAWFKELADGRAPEAPTQARADVQATRRDLATPGSAYRVGAERYAADGTLWRRTA